MTLWQRIKAWFLRGLKSDVQPAPSVRIPIENVSPVDLPKPEAPKPQESGPDSGICAALSWEKNHPERKVWSHFVFGLIGSDELFPIFDAAKDITRFYPRYNSLNKAQRATVWCELISAICLPESGWDPCNWMTEKTMGIDDVTGKQVKSEGLMQLSYQDVINYAGVLKDAKGKIDWSKDKFLDQNDPKKTIFDPFINLEAGIRILADQIKRTGCVILSRNVYWAVLKEGGKYSEIPQIVSMVQKLKFQ